MYSFLLPRRVDSPTSSDHGLARRHFLSGWDAAKFSSLSFSYGLTGVDQEGNYRWVHMFAIILCVITFFLLVLRISNMFWRHTRHLTVMANPEKQAFWARNQTSWWPWLNRHLLMAPLHKKRHNATWQISSAIDNGTLPGRWHFIMIVIYAVLNLAWCLCLPWSVTDRAEVVAALRGRSGTLAALNLMPTILFALRNNPLIHLLQVSYDDFNLFHRWAARITIAEAIVHTSCWLHNTLHAKGAQAIADALREEESYTFGMVASCSFVFIGIQAWSPFRHAFYETFLGIHRLMVLFALVGLYKHLETHALPQLPWMYIVATFYVGEYTIRGVYVLWYSVRPTRVSRIRVEALPGEAVRVTIHLLRDWHPRPGCHVHMYMPMLTILPSSHPFSVAWAYSTAPTSKEQSLGLLEAGAAPHALEKTRTINLVCRARTGFTRKMYEKACKAPNTYFETWGAIEGPYGGNHSLDSYGTCVLFAGGVGITHQVMYLKHLIEGYANGTTATQRILLCWTIPDSECLEWVRPWMDTILRMSGRKQVLRIKLFITRPKGRINNHVSESVKMFAGRMDVPTLLGEEIKSRVGAVAVTVCGSGPMADGVRAATRSFVEEGSVDFIEEAFTY